MHVRFSAAALADLDEIAEYITERSPKGAKAVLFAIETTIERLSRLPYSAPQTDESGVRMAPAGRYPYLIFYSVDADQLYIIRIIHGARQRPWQVG